MATSASGFAYTSDWRSTLDLATAALVGSVSATSYVLYTQVGLSQAGVLPLMKGTLAPHVRLAPADKVRTWRAFYNVAKYMALGGTALASACDAVAALTTRNRAVRNLAVASGVVGALIVPFTLAFIMPTNSALFALDDERALLDAKPADESARKADKLIDRWETLHTCRFAMYAGAAALSLCALLADNRSTLVATEAVVL